MNYDFRRGGSSPPHKDPSLEASVGPLRRGFFYVGLINPRLAVVMASLSITFLLCVSGRSPGIHRPGLLLIDGSQIPPLLPMRQFPPPWTVQRLPGGFKVVDASGQSLAYFYARENDNDAGTAGVLTMDEARRLASNFAPGCQFQPAI